MKRKAAHSWRQWAQIQHRVGMPRHANNVIPLTPVDWQVEAKCAELPIAKSDRMFFPDRGGSSKAAREICARCSVRDQCLEYALENQEQHGIWGGTSERERRRLRRGRKTEAA